MNAYGKQAVEIGAAHIALSAKGSGVVPGSDHVLSFSGQATVSIPPNALVISDPVKLAIPAAHDVAVSLFLPESRSWRRSALFGAAGHVYRARRSHWGGVDSSSGHCRVLGLSQRFGCDGCGRPTLVAFGDSITDGAHSTTDANHRWPNFFADRLLARSGHREIGVLDAGIGGNRILHDAVSNVRFGVNGLARFDRDVLAQPGIKYVIVLEGINDLGHTGTSAPTSETVSAEEIIGGPGANGPARARKRTQVFGATLTPFEGTTYPGYFTPEREVKRKAVNEWIRTGKVFDGFIDFDKAVRDPAHPDRMLPAYDSGDPCIRMMPATRPWPAPSTCRLSSKQVSASPSSRSSR